MKIVEYALSLPGTNAATESDFSSINKIWTIEKTLLNIKTLKYNLTNSCEKFHDILIKMIRIGCKVFIRIKNMTVKENHNFIFNKNFILIKNHNVQIIVFKKYFYSYQ